jgi:hypothetical protein
MIVPAGYWTIRQIAEFLAQTGHVKPLVTPGQELGEAASPDLFGRTPIYGDAAEMVARTQVGGCLFGGLLSASGMSPHRPGLVAIPQDYWRGQRPDIDEEITDVVFNDGRIRKLHGASGDEWTDVLPILGLDTLQGYWSLADCFRAPTGSPPANKAEHAVRLAIKPVTALDEAEAKLVQASRITDGYTRACHWIRDHAQTLVQKGSKPKRDPTLQECMAAARCGYREARAAWDALPAEYKNLPRAPRWVEP